MTSIPAPALILCTLLAAGCAAPQAAGGARAAAAPLRLESPLAAAALTPGPVPTGPLRALGPKPASEPEQQRSDAARAVAALQQGDFAAARREAEAVLARDPSSPDAHLVAAIARYRQAMHLFYLDARTVVFGAAGAGGLNHRYLRATLEQTELELAQIDASLAVAATAPDISLELCLACWQIDWNHNRRVDRADELLFQIEIDEQGNPLPEDDARRRPTFRFDRGDVLWARAFVSFQRAALDLGLAYDWEGLDEILAARDDRMPDRVVIRLAHPELVAEARRLLLAGLAFSDESRRAYLAETDDEREWVPSPRQRSHPLPLPVDQALYDTWEGVVGDLQRLVRGEEGLSVAELAQLGDHQWKSPPQGYLDLGRMLAAPRDIVLWPKELERLDRAHDVEGALRSVLGDYYVRRMKPSPLVRRLQRMKGEMDRGEESMERKLRYLLWIN
ncbi:MAG: hypothetical protein HY744_23465 [Deltaproteobacteria bacterium]|nr:hypothetical protein [Deltaproteobacteria bacterium]